MENNSSLQSAKPVSHAISVSRRIAAQVLALSTAVVSAYFWLSVPSLAKYSLQAFGACFVLFFVLKKRNDAAIWEVLPTTALDEMVLVTFAFLILIGATGVSLSIFFPLIFIYLFFLSMTMERWTALIISLLTTLFFYSLDQSIAQTPHFSQLLSMPLVMVFFMFAKYQYDQAKEKKTLLQIEHNEVYSYKLFLEKKEEELTAAENTTLDWLDYFQGFLFEFLQPKLDQLIQMMEFPQNHQVVRGQLTLIHLELEKLKQWLLHQQGS